MTVHFACNLACMHAIEQVIVKSAYLKVYCSCIPLIFVYKFLKCLLLICKVAHNIFHSVIKLDDLRHAFRYFITLNMCLIFFLCVKCFYVLISFSCIWILIGDQWSKFVNKWLYDLNLNYIIFPASHKLANVCIIL